MVTVCCGLGCHGSRFHRRQRGGAAWGVVEAEGLGDDRCRGLEDELVQCGQAAGNGRDAEVADERGDRAGGQWLAGAAAGEQPASIPVRAIARTCTGKPRPPGCCLGCWPAAPPGRCSSRPTGVHPPRSPRPGPRRHLPGDRPRPAVLPARRVPVQAGLQAPRPARRRVHPPPTAPLRADPSRRSRAAAPPNYRPSPATGTWPPSASTSGSARTPAPASPPRTTSTPPAPALSRQ